MTNGLGKKGREGKGKKGRKGKERKGKFISVITNGFGNCPS